MRTSVIYCTARKGGFDILSESIAHQTHDDIELIIVDELRRFSPERMNTEGFLYIEPPPKKPDTHWNLSASLNAGVRAASGELIILLQDYIYVPPDGIEKYIRRFEQEGPRCLVTGISDQFASPPADDPQGDWSIWSKFPGPPSGELIFKDPRNRDRGGFFVTIPLEWEANWGMFPKQAWLDVGGFDERYDAGWGYDNCDFSDRCQHAGYRIFLDCDNPVLCYSHINLFGEQKHRDSSPNNLELYRRLERERARHGGAWKLNYT